MAFAPGGGGKKAGKGGAAAPAAEAAEAASGAPVSVEVPSMGDSITEGSVAALLVKPGQKVAMDEVIAQIETDKVTIDVRASTSGTVTEVLAKEGDTVSVGQKVATLAPGAGPEKQASAAPAAASEGRGNACQRSTESDRRAIARAGCAESRVGCSQRDARAHVALALARRGAVEELAKHVRDAHHVQRNRHDERDANACGV